MSLPPRSCTTVVRIVGTLKALAAFARPMTLFTIIMGSWLCRLANWKGWWSIRTSTDSSGVSRALRPFLRTWDSLIGVHSGFGWRGAHIALFIAARLVGNGYNHFQVMLEDDLWKLLQTSNPSSAALKRAGFP